MKLAANKPRRADIFRAKFTALHLTTLIITLHAATALGQDATENHSTTT
jgi:hypothetical protein